MDVTQTLDAPRKPAPEFGIGQSVKRGEGRDAVDCIVADVRWRHGRWIYTFAAAPALTTQHPAAVVLSAESIAAGIDAARQHGGPHLYLPSRLSGTPAEDSERD
jgi:hypothetical protein